jgi:hypothetical protein
MFEELRLPQTFDASTQAGQKAHLSGVRLWLLLPQRGNACVLHVMA